jgi:hypothetical protein
MCFEAIITPIIPIPHMIKICHWCKEELHGLISDFVHCVRCNERRIVEGVNKIFDPCPICMAQKSESKFVSSCEFGRDVID